MYNITRIQQDFLVKYFLVEAKAAACVSDFAHSHKLPLSLQKFEKAFDTCDSQVYNIYRFKGLHKKFPATDGIIREIRP